MPKVPLFRRQILYRETRPLGPGKRFKTEVMDRNGNHTVSVRGAWILIPLCQTLRDYLSQVAGRV